MLRYTCLSHLSDSSSLAKRPREAAHRRMERLHYVFEVPARKQSRGVPCGVGTGKASPW